ncbi:pancreatic secretory granule membrane major glycoprotein GP2-like [Rhinoderma darwinii]|uniref:pancreatic secretory granule membrane major glycoprotein GP2-like n=1 Tax=Rhinoderma darwinii TaxID=43563 RepID=UPI003F67B9D6
MKVLLTGLLALCTVLSVHAVVEEACTGSNCTCDLTKYNASVTPPTPTINCANGNMTVYISKCQLQKSLFNTSNLALRDYTGPECASSEYLVGGEPQVTFHNPLNLAKCGNNVTLNATHAIYTNILHIYAEQHTLITRNNATANLSCIYPLNYPVMLNFTLKPVTSTTDISVPGVNGALTVTMNIYLESSFTSEPITDTTVLTVEQTVYVQVWIPGLEADTFSVKVISLYVTPGGTEPEDGKMYNLTTGSNGCPNTEYGADIITVLQNGNSTEARFAMKVFKITGQDYVKLFADVTICTSNCAVACGSKSVRSSLPSNVASLSVELIAESKISSGATDRFSLTWTLVSLISSLLFAKFM